MTETQRRWCHGLPKDSSGEGQCAGRGAAVRKRDQWAFVLFCLFDAGRIKISPCSTTATTKPHENLSHDPVTHKRVKNPHSGSQPLHSLGSRPILQAHLTRVPLCRRRCHWWRTACLHSPNWVRNFFSLPPPTDPFPPTEALWITHPQRLSSPAGSNHTCLYDPNATAYTPTGSTYFMLTSIFPVFSLSGF